MDNYFKPGEPEPNSFGQPVGPVVDGWHPPAPVQSASLTQSLHGRRCRLEPLEIYHAEQLQAAFDHCSESLWTYLPYGPFQGIEEYENWIAGLNRNHKQNAYPYGIFAVDGDQILGVSAYLRIDPDNGSVEIGHICFSPLLQQTVAATESVYMMIDAVFMLGYRRCEWKCNALNIPSIAAAGRFGFSYEGTFRQAQVIKERNRDTAWFSILDWEWPLLRSCYETWLDDDNFDAKGQQKQRLSTMTEAVRKGRETDGA